MSNNVIETVQHIKFSLKGNEKLECEFIFNNKAIYCGFYSDEFVITTDYDETVVPEHLIDGVLFLLVVVASYRINGK